MEPLIVADEIEEAVYIQHFFEEACRTQITALSQGRELILPPENVILSTAAGMKADRPQESVKLFAAFRRCMSN
jgi:ribulose-5-phosphate 4-epimerase/fuculose-1-phosphate aldolase